MSNNRLDLGRFGEDVAGSFLLEKGYRILEKNWRFKKGEIDLVCTLGKMIVFVEVKSRSEDSPGETGEALSHGQKIRLLKTASHYLCKNGLWERECRFDLVCVTAGSEVVVEHVENAIEFSIMGGGNSTWQPW